LSPVLGIRQSHCRSELSGPLGVTLGHSAMSAQCPVCAKADIAGRLWMHQPGVGKPLSFLVGIGIGHARRPPSGACGKSRPVVPSGGSGRLLCAGRVCQWLIHLTSTTRPTGASAPKKLAPLRAKSAIQTLRSQCCGLLTNMSILPDGPQRGRRAASQIQTEDSNSATRACEARMRGGSMFPHPCYSAPSPVPRLAGLFPCCRRQL
jgi:hypothetical protein